MFQKILIAEDMDFINSGIKSQLSELEIKIISGIFLSCSNSDEEGLIN